MVCTAFIEIMFNHVEVFVMSLYVLLSLSFSVSCQLKSVVDVGF